MSRRDDLAGAESAFAKAIELWKTGNQGAGLDVVHPARLPRRSGYFRGVQYILQLMKSLLVEVDDELADRLERIAPARSRRRSEFVRAAILKALCEAEEQATAEAYARLPDSPEAAFDPTVWEGRGAPGER